MNVLLRATAVFAFLPSALVQDPAPPKVDPARTPAPKREPIFDEKADGGEQIAAALARAGKENRRVLVEWGANW